MNSLKRAQLGRQSIPAWLTCTAHAQCMACDRTVMCPVRVPRRTFYTATPVVFTKRRRLRVSPVPAGTSLDGKRDESSSRTSSSSLDWSHVSPSRETLAAPHRAEFNQGNATGSEASAEAPLHGDASPSPGPTADAASTNADASVDQPTTTSEPASQHETDGGGRQEAPESRTPDAAVPSVVKSKAVVTSDAAADDEDASNSEQSFMKRMFNSWQQGVVASIGAAMGVGFLIYVLYAPVKEDTVHHTAMVASEALADLRIKKQAVSLSKEVVANVLQDPRSVQLVSQLVVTLLAQEETKVAISSLLQSLFEDHYTQEVTKKFVLMIVRDPWIEDQVQSIVKEQVIRLLEDDEVKAALSQYLLDSASTSLSRPDLHYTAARAARSTVARFFNPWWTI